MKIEYYYKEDAENYERWVKMEKRMRRDNIKSLLLFIAIAAASCTTLFLL